MAEITTITAPANRFYVGYVVSNHDIDEAGGFYAEIPDLDLKSQFVNYVSPYIFPNAGGFFAPPFSRSKVLILYLGDGVEEGFYFMGSMSKVDYRFPEEKYIQQLKPFKNIKQREVYNKKNCPQSIFFTNQFDAGFYVYRHLDDDVKNFNSRVELKSEKGKIVTLNDNPNNDCIFIYNNHTESILITGDGDKDHGPRQIQIRALNTISQESYKGDFKIFVTEGRELNIQNTSTGANRPPDSEHYGNINIRSEERDINIVANNRDDSSIFILTPKARIQIDDNGDIRIHSSTGNINIDTSDGDVNIQGRNLNIDFDTISMKSGGESIIHAGAKLSLRGDSEVAADGAIINLNSGSSSSSNGVDDSVFEHQRTLYGE